LLDVSGGGGGTDGSRARRCSRGNHRNGSRSSRRSSATPNGNTSSDSTSIVVHNDTNARSLGAGAELDVGALGQRRLGELKGAIEPR